MLGVEGIRKNPASGGQATTAEEQQWNPSNKRPWKIAKGKKKRIICDS